MCAGIYKGQLSDYIRTLFRAILIWKIAQHDLFSHKLSSQWNKRT